MSDGQKVQGGELPAPAGIRRGPGKSRPAKVMNKVAAQVQITAEQLLREAKDRMEREPKMPQQKIHDKEELMEYRLTKRKRFEDLIRKNRTLLTNWTKYARWEESQGEFTRARSIYERALEHHQRNPSIWMRYAEMEVRAENVNMARNVWVRATTILPRVDAIWLKWVLMEETAGDVAMCRQVFDRWMSWKPKPHGWHMYAKFELRFGEVDKAREVIKQMVTFFNDTESWLYYAKFEEKHGKASLARRVYEEGLDALGDEASEKMFVAFAKFEERQKEFERARSIYKIALDRIPKDKAPELYQMFVEFEKQFGEREGIEEAVISRKRFEYEESLREVPDNWDTWVNYVRLEESQADPEKTREVYERAIATIPTIRQKIYWGRYIYLWIMYAQFEELDMEDIERARTIWQTCLRVIPHSSFSFSKIWIAYAMFELRQNRLDECRKILGKGLGVNPRPKLYRIYINLETQIGNIDRVRQLYQAWLKNHPGSATVWGRFAEFEVSLLEHERARAIFELGVGQETLDQPEALWKKYIQFEIRLKDYDRARELYRRLADRTKHVKVYLVWATFEANTAKNPEKAREVYEEADAELSQDADQDKYKLLLTSWKVFEDKHGTEQQVQKVFEKLNPDKAPKKHKKLLAQAQAWKKKKMEQ